MKNVYLEFSETKLGRKKSRKTKPFISEEVMKLAQEKSKARKDGRKDYYKRLKREVKSKIRRDRKDWLEKECAKITEHNENRKSRELFEQVRKISKTNSSRGSNCLKNKEGTTLTENEDVLSRWYEYGSSLFENPTNISSDPINCQPESLELEPEPLIEEVEMATKQLKCRKSPGLDNVPGELLKHSGKGGLTAMHYLCCKIWKSLEWPTDWKLQEFVMLHKSGDAKDCNNYRTIALISHASKILLIIILSRLKPKIEQELSDCQAGYRSNRGTIDMLFTLQNLIEKSRNTAQEAFITFIDYSKALTVSFITVCLKQ